MVQILQEVTCVVYLYTKWYKFYRGYTGLRSICEYRRYDIDPPIADFFFLMSLEPLNAVTIAHLGIPPATDDLAAHFSGRAYGGVLDLYVGYNERILAESSRDYTTFQTPFGAL